MPGVEELLVEEMQDLLRAEGQLVKSLPKMSKAAHEYFASLAGSRPSHQRKIEVNRYTRRFCLQLEAPLLTHDRSIA
jgi:ferritin-like metal-binding protein YciE